MNNAIIQLTENDIRENTKMLDYSSFDKNQLIQIINKQDKELKAKKYGLVWDSEREPEQVVLVCEKNLPILKLSLLQRCNPV